MSSATRLQHAAAWGLTASRGRLIVISGPSGVGKDAVLRALFRAPSCPPHLVRCITATTRSPRPGEADGRDYFFLGHDDFVRKAAAGYFLEHALYAGDHYGTPRPAVEQLRSEGDDVVLKIEVQGALQVRSSTPDAVLVFLLPPSWAELENRLRLRATDDAKEVARRLEIARAEIEVAGQYDYAVVNDMLEDAVDGIRSIVLAERARVIAPAP